MGKGKGLGKKAILFGSISQVAIFTSPITRDLLLNLCLVLKRLGKIFYVINNKLLHKKYFVIILFFQFTVFQKPFIRLNFINRLTACNKTQLTTVNYYTNFEINRETNRFVQLR